MAALVADRVVDTTTITGTGAVTVAGVGVAGFRPITSGNGFGVATTFYYLIEAVDANGVPTGDWEVGLATVTATAPVVFTRTLVHSSSNNGSAVSFAAGVKRVHCVAPAATTGIAAGQFRKAASLTAQNLTTAAAITWDTSVFQTSPINFLHDNVTNPSRITLPADYGDAYVKLSGQVGLAAMTANDIITLSIKWNGASAFAQSMTQVNSTSPVAQITAPIVLATTTDYFELFVQTGTSNSVTISATLSRFQIEILQ